MNESLHAFVEIALRVTALQIETRIDAAKAKSGHGIALSLILAASAVRAMKRAADEIEAAHGARHWRCFHCDEVFTGAEQARLHFGMENDGIHFEAPACISPLRYDELARLRELKAAWADVDEAHRERDDVQGQADAYHGIVADLEARLAELRRSAA